MGIASALLGDDHPFSRYVADNRYTLKGAFAGLGQGRTFGEGLGYAAQGAYAGAPADMQVARDEAEKAERQEAINQSAKDLAKFPDLMQAVASKAITPQAAYGEAWKRMSPDYNGGGADDPASWREWEHFNTLTPEQQNQYLVMKRSVPYLDTGTDFVRPDAVTGQTVGAPTIAKDNFTPAYDAASGTAQGKVDVETKAAFDSLNSKLPGIKKVVAELGTLAEQATYTISGKLWDDVARETGAMPSEGALARAKYIAMVDNQVLPLLRDTFGAAFTVKEGETLRATLGNPNISPPEKKAVLEAFIEQKVMDLEALQRRLPGAEQAAAPTARFKFNPATGELE
jgi:hypothetical protein